MGIFPLFGSLLATVVERFDRELPSHRSDTLRLPEDLLVTSNSVSHDLDPTQGKVMDSSNPAELESWSLNYDEVRKGWLPGKYPIAAAIPRV